MGCTSSCSPVNPTPARSHSSLADWKASTSALLSQVFAQEREELWLTEVLHSISAWEEGDFDFRSNQRFEEYAMLNLTTVDLKYRQKDRHPLWAMLETDLADIRNPVGSLLQTFSVTLARHRLELAHDVSQHPADASFLLASITADILKMIYVLRESVLAYYEPIADLLRARHEDVESLALNCVVQGDLYVLMQRLAQVLVARRAEMLRRNISEQEDEPVADLVAKVRALLQRFILTESITEKRELLEEVEFLVFSNSHAKDGPRQLLIASFLALGLQSINSDLLITKLLTSKTPEFLYFLMDCVDAATSD